ncbi:MAG: diacylglycerol kinase family protein [Bacillota bacterium]
MDKVLQSLRNAFFGLKYCFITQRNMVIHALVGSIVFFMALLLRVSVSHMLFLLTAIILLLVAEAFNTAIEKTIDLYTKKRNNLAHVAKDVAAGAVLLASFFAVITVLTVLGPPLWLLVKSILLF